MKCTHCSSDQYSINVTCANCGIIYKALPHWVGLTNEEYTEIRLSQERDDIRTSEMLRKVEAKLKEKNT